MLIQGIMSDNLKLPTRPKKRMLSVHEENGQTIVHINYSSLEILQTCKRKAYYALNRQLVSNEENQATLFGSAIHKGLEVWYSQPRKSRNIELAISAFNEVSNPLRSLDLGDKRHPYNGEKILNTYFAKYADDPFEILSDSQGPLVERSFEFVLYEEPNLKVIYFGTIDAILRNVETNTILVCDHKTTSSLGSEFYNRIKPNHQYTGYIMGAKFALGIDTDLFLVNGLQVAKTKVDLARQVTQRTSEDFEELKGAVRWAVSDYLNAEKIGFWPQNSPNPCSMYGSCQYRSVCEVPTVIKENVLNALFNKGEK